MCEAERGHAGFGSATCRKTVVSPDPEFCIIVVVILFDDLHGSASMWVGARRSSPW